MIHLIKKEYLLLTYITVHSNILLLRIWCRNVRIKPTCIVNQNDPNTVIRCNVYIVVIAVIFGDFCTVAHYNILLFIQSGSTVLFGYDNAGKRQRYNDPLCIQIQYSMTGVTFGISGRRNIIFFLLCHLERYSLIYISILWLTEIWIKRRPCRQNDPTQWFRVRILCVYYYYCKIWCILL